MEAYIKSAAIISPQKTFDEEFPLEIMQFSGVRYLKCVEPVYRDYIDPMISRRMSRVVKMGVCSALKCMRKAGVEMPDGIIAGTGLGCLEDTEKFLASIFTNNEKLLNPTPFIQSTHNTVAGAIALAIKCHNYNSTYTHRGFSFESALTDALLHLADNPDLNILTGGFDELTDSSFSITSRLGLWKNHDVDSSRLEEYKTRGSIPGEGVAFFMLSGKKNPDNLARIAHVKTAVLPDSGMNIENLINDFMHEAGISADDADVVIMGVNGDPRADKVYYQMQERLFHKQPCLRYKYLCGEYDTASSFALYMGSLILKQQRIISLPGLVSMPDHPVNRILIYNHIRSANHSLFLLERC